MPVAPLAALAEAVETLAACDPSELAGPEELVALETLSGRLEAVVASAAGRFAAEGTYAEDGALSPTAWLTTRTHRPRREVAAQLRLAKLLEALPEMAEGVRSGRFGTAQVRLAGRLLSPRTREGLRSAEGFLCEQAGERTYREYERVVAYLGQFLDPDGCEASAEARRARRDVFLAAGFEGSWSGQIKDLDPIAGAIVWNELNRLAERAYRSDVAEAKERLGHDPGPGELARTPAQRRADALVEMARRSAGLEDESARFFLGATRRAVELRDRECQHPYCEASVERCQVDHVVPFSEGGETTQANGRLLCGPHNRLRLSRPDLPDPPRPPSSGP